MRSTTTRVIRPCATALKQCSTCRSILLTSHFSLLTWISVAIAADPQPDPAALQRSQQQTFRQAVERVAACVVTIETIGGTQPSAGPIAASRPAEERKPGTPRGVRPRGAGSGFIIADGPTTGLIYSADGLIMTSAFNFVRDPSVITVVLPNGRRFVGELLARDEVRQLAMLKVDARDLPTPPWIESEKDVRVGQWALALGRGFGGPDCSVSAGIISGMNRQSSLAVQTDAKLSPANFGGPLIDVEGRVLGICVPMGMTTGEMAGIELYDSGIGFAVPQWQVVQSAKDLAVGHNLRRGLMGVAIDRQDEDHIRVLGVGDPSPAARAGVMAGDHITAIDGKEVRNYPELQRLMRRRLAGERITIRVQRGGEQLDLRLMLAVPEDLGDIPQSEPEPPPPTTQSDEPPTPEPKKRRRE